MKVKKAEWSLFPVIEELGTQKGFVPRRACKVLLGITGEAQLVDPQISTNSILVFLHDHHSKHFVLGETESRSRKTETKRPREKIIHCKVIKLHFEHIQVIKSNKQKRYLKECPSVQFFSLKLWLQISIWLSAIYLEGHFWKRLSVRSQEVRRRTEAKEWRVNDQVSLQIPVDVWEVLWTCLSNLS